MNKATKIKGSGPITFRSGKEDITIHETPYLLVQLDPAKAEGLLKKEELGVEYFKLTPEETVEPIPLTNDAKDDWKENHEYILLPSQSLINYFNSGKNPDGVYKIRRLFQSKKQQILIESNDILVKIQYGTKLENILPYLNSLGLREPSRLNFSTNLFSFKLVTTADPLYLCDLLSRDSRINYAEPDWRFPRLLKYIPADLLYGIQWHHNNTGANGNGPLRAKPGCDVQSELAWGPNLANPDAGQGIKIAVLEYAFDIFHPDIAPALCTTINPLDTGVPAVISRSGTIDTNLNHFDVSFLASRKQNSHGTHTSGLALARSNFDNAAVNNSVVGTAFRSSFLPIRMKDPSASGVARAIAYAADPSTEIPTANPSDGADVVSMSFGVGEMNNSLREAIRFALVQGRKGKGTILINAASNEFLPLSIDPMPSVPELITIGNIGVNELWQGCGYADNDLRIDVVAPGTDVISTHPSNLPAVGGLPVGYSDGLIGTSYSTPIVAGIIAVMLQAEPNLTWQEIKLLLRRSALPVDAGFVGGVDAGIDARTPNLGWKTGDNPAVLNDYILDNSGDLITAGFANSTLATPAIAPIAAPFDVSTFTLNAIVGGGLAPGQSIRIGNRDTIVAINSVLGAQTVTINNGALFSPGQTIQLGNGAVTNVADLLSNVPFGNNKTTIIIDAFGTDRYFNNTILQNQCLPVLSPCGFSTGDRIFIRNTNNTAQCDTRTITNIFNIHGYPMVVFELDTALTFDYEYGDFVGKFEEVIISGVAGNVISIDPGTPIVNPSPHTLGLTRVHNEEIRVIRNIAGPVCSVDTLIYSHAIGEVVQGGGSPLYSGAYGYGRADANRAISFARNFTFAAESADMVIRDSLLDNGTAITVNPVNSPDIWIWNDFAGGPAPVPPLNYNTAGPVAQPYSDVDRRVYFRIKNIGAAANFETEVRLYIALSDAPASFDYPRDSVQPELKWVAPPGDAESRNIAAIRDGQEGIYYLGKKVIAAGTIAANGEYSDYVTWNEIDIPPVNNSMNAHLLAQVSPFDGLISGTTVNGNNNLSFKAIQIIRRISFYDQANLPLPYQADFNAYASPLIQLFEIRLNTPLPDTFNPANTTITIKLKHKKGGDETAVMKHDGVAWNFDAPPPSWITFTGGLTNPGLVSSHNFQGNYTIGSLDKYIEFTVEVTGVGVGFPFNSKHRMKTKILDFPDDVEVNNSKGPRIHFFTVTDSLVLLNQNASGAFGPYTDAGQPTKDFYRLNSLHKASGTAKAYAICNGLVAVQEVDASRVNIILKPIEQPGINFVPVKYFIYKGIKRSSLFNGANITAQNTNQLTNTIWTSANNRYNDAVNKSAAMVPPPPPPVQTDFIPPADKTLGMHLTAVSNAALYGNDKPVDNLFFEGDNDFQLPVVFGGWDIGEFEAGGGQEFGLEIVLESVNYTPLLESVRTVTHIIEEDKLAVPDADDFDSKFENRLRREKASHYMDPAAFYGSFYGNRIFIMPTGNASLVGPNDFTETKGNNIYSNVLLNRFVNAGRTYVDIRNENGFSFNFYRNYHDELKVAMSEGGKLETLNYYGTSNWPVMIFESTSWPLNTSEKKNIFEIQMPVSATANAPTAENPVPLVYFSQGYSTKRFNKSMSGKERFVKLNLTLDVNNQPANQYSENTVSIATANVTGGAAATPVASLIRLKYLKRFETPPAQPAATSGIIPRRVHYLDHLFTPIQLQIPFSNVANIRSIVLDDEGYVDGQYIDLLKLDGIVKIGMAEDNNSNVTVFAYISDLNDKQGARKATFALSGETKNEDGSYIEQVQRVYPNISPFKTVLGVNSNQVDLIILDEESSTQANFESVDSREFFGIMLTSNQYQDIITSCRNAANFYIAPLAANPLLPVYMAFEKVAGDADPHLQADNMRAFSRYEIILRGWKKNANTYQINSVNTGIIIYTDGHL